MLPGEIAFFSDILRTAGVLSGRSLGRSRWRRTMRGRKFGRTSRRDEHADVRTVRPYRDRREVTGGMLRPPARAGRATASIRPVSCRTRRHGRGWSKAGSARGPVFRGERAEVFPVQSCGALSVESDRADRGIAAQQFVYAVRLLVADVAVEASFRSHSPQNVHSAMPASSSMAFRNA